MKLKLRWHMYKYAPVPSINNVCQQQQTTKSIIFQQQLHLILSDIITWCGLENSDTWDISRMTKSGCGCGHRMINCVNNIWLKSDDRLEKASIIISAASWFLTRLKIIKPYYTLLLGTWNILQSIRKIVWMMYIIALIW